MLTLLLCASAGFLVGALVLNADSGTNRGVRNYWRQGGDK